MNTAGRALGLFAGLACVTNADATTPQDTRGLVDELNTALLTSHSATLVLESWCARHGLASPARIVAQVDRGAAKPPTEADRQLLGIGPRVPVGYRHVRLLCGARILSLAENWYVPGRLTPDMNRVLEHSDTPFGYVVRPLSPSRRNLSVERVPLPAGGGIPPIVLRHRALLTDERGRPIALVVENYTRDVVGF
jgi:hypothetical protein